MKINNTSLQMEKIISTQEIWGQAMAQSAKASCLYDVDVFFPHFPPN